MKYQKITCNLCGDKEYKQLARCKIEKADADLPMEDISIVKCANCGLVYANPRPEYSPEEFNKLYSEEYFNAPYMRFYIEKEGRQSNESFTSRLAWIEKFKRNGRILDIGCASGGFLRMAKDRGWEAFGVEVSKTAAEIAREKYGLPVSTGKLDEAGFDNEFFDVVTVNDVLEHIENSIKSRLLRIKENLLY